MKSKFKYILSTCLLFLGMTACDVNRLPETSISDETFWRSETDLIAATNYLYTFIKVNKNKIKLYISKSLKILKYLY